MRSKVELWSMLNDDDYRRCRDVGDDGDDGLQIDSSKFMTEISFRYPSEVLALLDFAP